MVSPSFLLTMVTYEMSENSKKSWIVFGLAVLLLITTSWGYIDTIFLVPEIPANAQTAVGLVVLPIYQIIGGGALGCIAWGVVYFWDKQSE